MYSFSINFYYLIVIRFDWSVEYLNRRLEPWLHVLSLCLSIIPSTTFLFWENYNDDFNGSCWVSNNNIAPHCMGIEDGVVREGFTIPCGRGRNSR